MKDLINMLGYSTLAVSMFLIYFINPGLYMTIAITGVLFLLHLMLSLWQPSYINSMVTMVKKWAIRACMFILREESRIQQVNFKN